MKKEENLIQIPNTPYQILLNDVKQLIKMLASALSIEYGNAFSKRNLDYYRQFYLSFKDFEIVNTRVHNLSWSHFRRLLSVANPDTRGVTF